MSVGCPRCAYSGCSSQSIADIQFSIGKQYADVKLFDASFWASGFRATFAGKEGHHRFLLGSRAFPIHVLLLQQVCASTPQSGL